MKFVFWHQSSNYLLINSSHDNIISYKEAFFDDSSSSLCSVLEWCDDGDLMSKISEHLKKGTCFKEQEIWNFIRQIVSGLKALHD